jgi:hypothetical protein
MVARSESGYMDTPILTPDALLNVGMFLSEERHRALVETATTRSVRSRQPVYGL